jgi:predicted DNA-binding transcriptional regulator AlpA
MSLSSRVCDFDRLPDSALLTVAEISTLSGRSRSSIWRDIKNCRLPEPVTLSPHASRWRAADVRVYLTGSGGKRAALRTRC